mmetsp:Transcript_32510/g.65377  ORF Transcript_32510/g.65377 Transcript_32510/m.65377 type:complete len:1503 (+) Transcript_32510:171-4679(+)
MSHPSPPTRRGSGGNNKYSQKKRSSGNGNSNHNNTHSNSNSNSNPSHSNSTSRSGSRNGSSSGDGGSGQRRNRNRPRRSSGGNPRSSSGVGGSSAHRRSSSGSGSDGNPSNDSHSNNRDNNSSANYTSNYFNYNMALADINEDASTGNKGNAHGRIDRDISSSLFSSGGITNMMSMVGSQATGTTASYVHSESSPVTTSTEGSSVIVMGNSSSGKKGRQPQGQQSPRSPSSGKARRGSLKNKDEDPFHLSSNSLATSRDDDNDDTDDISDGSSIVDADDSVNSHFPSDDDDDSQSANLTNDETLLTTSTTSQSLRRSAVMAAVQNNNHGVPLADPSTMTTDALQMELKFRGVETYRVTDRTQLEQAVVFARKNSGSNSGGSGGRYADDNDDDDDLHGESSDKLSPMGGGGGTATKPRTSHRTGVPGHRRQSSMENTAKAVNTAPRPRPDNPPTSFGAANNDAAKNNKKLLPVNIRLRTGDSEAPGNNDYDHIHSSPNDHYNHPSNNLAANNHTPNSFSRHIPLTSQNKIPPQILNLIRTSADRKMTAIDLSGKPIGDLELAKLADALLTNMTVEILNLNECRITDAGISSICDILNKNEIVEELYLGGNHIGVEGAAAISTALITNETLRVLSLNGNAEIGDKGVVYLIGALEHNSTLVDLQVHGCGCYEGPKDGAEGHGNLAAAATNRIRQIDDILYDRRIDSNFESLLERLFDDDFRVTGIDLTGRQIGAKGVTRLAEALADNTQVRQLWLRDCGVDDDGAMALASCLEQNMTIVDLFLGSNHIGDEGLKSISDALALSNLTLVSLEMDGNRVGDSGIDYFYRALDKNTSLLVASFENNRIEDFEKLEMLQKFLGERRSGLNLVSFVVDPDGGSTVGSANNPVEGVINMSVCSSYMPSTYRRAGMTSVVGESSSIKYKRNNSFTKNGLAKFPARKRGSDGSGAKPRPPRPNGDLASHNFSVYNKANSFNNGPPAVGSQVPSSAVSQAIPEAVPQVVPEAVSQVSPQGPPQVATHGQHRVSPGNSDKSGGKSSSGSGSSSKRRGSHSHSKSSPISRRPPNRPQGSHPNPSELPPPPHTAQHSSSQPQVQTSQMKRDIGKDREMRKNGSSSGRFSSSDSAIHQRQGHVHRSSDNRHPLHRSLNTIAEVESRTSSKESSSKHSTKNHGKKRNGRSKSNEQSNDNRRSNSQILPMNEKLIAVQEDSGTVKTEISTDEEQEESSQTSKNFDTTLKKLLRRIEVMRYMNRFATSHYRARHFWLCFIPISAFICLAGILSFVSASDVNATTRMSLSAVTGVFCLLAFILNFFQTRLGWGSLAEIHRSSELELSQVVFRLETLKKYEHGRLCSKSVSSKARASAVRDLYRIDVYLQAVMKCTPQVPDKINETFGLLASRLKSICLKYPHAVKSRFTNGDYDDEPMDPSNPVPVEMQVDALALLSKEIRSYWLFPLLMPNPVEVVSRTIDMFFAGPNHPDNGNKARSEEGYSVHSPDDYDHHASRIDIV